MDAWWILIGGCWAVFSACAAIGLYRNTWRKSARNAGHAPPKAAPPLRFAGWNADQELMKLADQWEGSARKQFECSARTNDEMGKRVMDHGAMIYANCARRIREVLNEPSPPSSATQEGPGK